MSRRLIVGLGNPGKEYQDTRHNVGFLVLEALAKQESASFKKKSSLSYAAEISWKGEKLALVKPLTFMNLSGQAVREFVDRLELSWQTEIIVIVDDADLEFGKLRFREKGSSGGHRGLASIAESLGGIQFPRLRIGIGRPSAGEVPLKDFVLDAFTGEEKKELPAIMERAVSAILLWVEQGPRAVMNQFN